ncbi:MAG TPA: YcxB family protein [Bacillota bacterium]
MKEIYSFRAQVHDKPSGPITRWIMAIQTKEFRFTKAVYFRNLLDNYLQKSWWAVFFLGFVVIYAAYRGERQTLWICMGLALAYPIYILIRCFIHTNSKRNRLFFAERYFVIDNQLITGHFHDGSTNRIQLSSIVRVIKKGGAYQLFISKRQFIYIPVSCFKTPQDIERFDKLLKQRKPSQ